MHVIYKGSILNKIADEIQEAIKNGHIIESVELNKTERHLFIQEIQRQINDGSMDIIYREGLTIMLDSFIDTGKGAWLGIIIHYNGWAG